MKHIKVCVIYKGDLAIKNLNYHILCNFHNWWIPYINLIGVITFSVTWYLILWVHVYVWNILYVFPHGSLETFNLNKCNVSLDISGDVYQFTKDVAKVDMWLCTSISNWDAIFEYKIVLSWNTSYYKIYMIYMHLHEYHGLIFIFSFLKSNIKRYFMNQIGCNKG